MRTPATPPLVIILGAWICGLVPEALAAPPLLAVESSIDGRIFIWHVTHEDGPPISRFEVPVYSVYNPTAPEGWRLETVGGILKAWAESDGAAIQPGQKAKFSVRGASAGSVLTEGSAVVGWADGGTMTIPRVWVPQPEKIWTKLIPPVVLVGIVLLDALIMRRWR